MSLPHKQASASLKSRMILGPCWSLRTIEQRCPRAAAWAQKPQCNRLSVVFLIMKRRKYKNRLPRDLSTKAPVRTMSQNSVNEVIICARESFPSHLPNATKKSLPPSWGPFFFFFFFPCLSHLVSVTKTVLNQKTLFIYLFIKKDVSVWNWTK